MQSVHRKKRKSLAGKIIDSFKYKGNLDLELIVLIFIMVLFGLIMVASASTVTSLYKYDDSMATAKKQLIFAVIGFVAMLVVSKVDYHIYTAPKILMWGLAIIWALVLGAALFGEARYGARRWILGFQPSELAKIGWILLFASVCSAQTPKQLANIKTSWMKYAVLILAIAVPLLLQPHKSATMLIGMVCFVIVVVAGANLRPLIALGPVAAVVVGIILLSSEYSRQRLMSFGNPFNDVADTGWQAVQSLFAIGTGGLFGKGLGKSVQKDLNIPEPHNDFIYSIICEELGFVGAAVVLILFFLLLMRCIKIAMEAPDKMGTLIVVGITALIFIQVFINVAVVTSIFPVTGMPLPFFSAGGTSTMITIASMGIVLNISRQGKTKNLKSGSMK